MNWFRAHRLPSSATATRWSRRRRRRTAHTLIEILLALGLSLVILTAVYAALDQHWRSAEAGQQQTERMQVTRALFERLSSDLRATVFRPAVELDHTPGTSNVTRMNIVQQEEPYLGHSVGIMGDAETLLAQISGPATGRLGTGTLNGPRTVRWEMRAIESSGSAQAQAPPDRSAATAATAKRVSALTRVAREITSPTPLARARRVAPSDVVAAEVETIRFRYFSRGSWFERWDSVGQGELPRAVEITIGFRRANSRKQEAGDQTSAGEYRLVVPIPASEA